MPTEILIDPRFNGPPGSANGGYTCGLVGGLLAAPAAEVTLRLPPPLGRPLRWDGERLWDDDSLVAEGRGAVLDLDVPEPPSFEEAEAARPRFAGFREHTSCWNPLSGYAALAWPSRGVSAPLLLCRLAAGACSPLAGLPWATWIAPSA